MSGTIDDALTFTTPDVALSRAVLVDQLIGAPVGLFQEEHHVVGVEGSEALGQRVDGHLGGHVAAVVAAHAVGHGQDQRLRAAIARELRLVDEILVALSDVARVRACSNDEPAGFHARITPL